MKKTDCYEKRARRCERALKTILLIMGNIILCVVVDIVFLAVTLLMQLSDYVVWFVAVMIIHKVMLFILSMLILIIDKIRDKALSFTNMEKAKM